MPKTVSSKEFRIKMKDHISTLKEDGGYIVVANESNIDGMFIAMSPEKFTIIADRAGMVDEKNGIEAIYNLLKERISDRYRKMRLDR